MFPVPPITMQHLPTSFIKLLDSEPLEVQQQMLTALKDNIAILESANTPQHCNKTSGKASTHNSPHDDISEYVGHVDNPGINDDLANGILTELQSLSFKSSKLDKVKTLWLSPLSDSYNYADVINDPKPINAFPNICHLMSIVNQHPSTSSDADACLVSYFPSSKAGLALHKDDEDLISQSSSICTVSFGAPRTLQFVRDGKLKNGRKDLTSDLSLPATDRSMNVMKPGAQAVMKHRVPKGNHIRGGSNIRYSLSFRKIAVQTEEEVIVESVDPPKSDPPKPDTRKHVILVAGDSFPARLDAKRLCKGKKIVVNIAKGGSKIDKVKKSVEDYIDENPSVVVTKLFISIGTNDIRHCQNGISHLKNTICDFMRFVKTILPSTTIYFQSLLPIHPNGCSYTEINVIAMNNLIYSLCSRFKLYFIDVFNSFLNVYGTRNEKLFPEYDEVKGLHDIHPNKRGMGVLARTYIYLIHSRWFNPLGY